MALEEGMRRRRRLDVSPTFNCRPRPKQNIIENGETLDTYHYTFQATATEKSIAGIIAKANYSEMLKFARNSRGIYL